MEIREIQQGTRVTYAIGDVEYDAVALGAVTTGYNHAIRSGGFFLSLRYLNEQGEPVTVNGAPLLGIEDTDLSAPRTTGWHARRADDDKRPEPLPVQPAPVHEFAQEARTPPPAVLGIGPVIVPPPVVEAEEPGSSSEKYGTDAWTDSGDGTGYPGLPTQAQADAIVAAAEAERFETKTYADGSTATGVAPLPDLSPAEQDLAEGQAKAAEEIAAAEAGRPSASDLDAVAADPSVAPEVAIIEPAAEPTADEPAPQTEAADPTA